MVLPRKDEKVSGSVREKASLLIVDDEASIVKSIKRLLRREPYVVRTAESGPQALAMMQEEPADVVVSDFRMPDMVGTELLEQIRTRWPETIRIILSGYSEVTAILSAINRGQIYKYLTKPWNDEELKLHLRRAIESKQLELDNQRLNHQLKRQNEMLFQRYADCEIGLGFTQRLMESVATAVVCLDAEGLVVYANGQAIDLLAQEQSEFVGLQAAAVLPAALMTALKESAPAGRLRVEGNLLLWRQQAFKGQGQSGTIVSLFQDVEGRVW